MTRKKLLFAYNFLLFLIACTIVLITTVQVSYGQTTETYSAAGSYTFTVPAGVTSITVKAWGGGGGGGYSNSGNGNKSAAGGGGGGGGYRTGTFNVIGGQTITIEVGVGGNGASADGQGGSPGGNSTVTYSGISIIANGGGGGGRGIDKNKLL